MNILFIGVNPRDTNPLRLQYEINIIKDVLDRQQRRGGYNLKVRNASTVESMRRYLNKYKPNILHISGHGNDDGTLIFEDENGHSEFINTSQLGDFLSNYSSHLNCVVLSACYSLNNIENFSESIHCVIGMKVAIENTKAMSFSKSFYDSIISGNSFKLAFDIAKDEMNLSQDDDDEILKIIVNENIVVDTQEPEPSINWKLVFFILLCITIVVITYLLFNTTEIIEL